MAHKPHLFEGFPFHIGSEEKIIHYTCNAPKEDVLNKNNILPIGEKFNSDNREILEIPLSIYNKHGFSEINDKNILKINSELLMRKLK